MKIGIDARMYGPKAGGGGLGRYVEQLVNGLQRIDHENRYVLFVKDKEVRGEDDRFETREVNVHWYTLKEQIVLPRIMDRTHLDLIHFPHWNVPLGIRTPFVVTIHDLILLEEPRSAKATTRHPLVYKMKYAGYRKVLKHAIEASCAIIAVSNYTKSSILKFFPQIDPEKIHVVYEGVTRLEATDSRQPPQTPPWEGGEPREYFLYIGNAYPHKNLEMLIEAFKSFHSTHRGVELVLAGRETIFYKRLQENNPSVTFIMDPTDADLAELYKNALGYLFPSRIEGFGLPPLEAMAHGTPVAASRSSCLPEILEDAAIYFSPTSRDEMIQAMMSLYDDDEFREQLIKKGYEQIRRYSWNTMAQQIIKIYETCGDEKI